MRAELRRETGFTLIEVLVGIALGAVLLTLAAFALRQFWLVRSLHGGADSIVTQLRSQQNAAVTESHPLVFGIRFRPGSSTFGLVRVDPSDDPDSCVQYQTGTLTTGVFVNSASFAGTSEQATCAADPRSGFQSDDIFVFFFPRGTATQGTLTVQQPSLGSSQQITISVGGITGRVTRT